MILENEGVTPRTVTKGAIRERISERIPADVGRLVTIALGRKGVRQGCVDFGDLRTVVLEALKKSSD